MLCEVSMKKFFISITALILFSLSGIFTACRSEQKPEVDEKSKIKIVVTTFPLYDWVCNIVEDNADVELLINSGTDLHSWNPAAKDILKITGKDTDLFIYIGGESDFWVDKLIPQMKANEVQYFSIMKENVELLEPMGDHDHDHGHEESEDVEAGVDGRETFDPDEYDEHIWLSIKRAPLFVKSIAEKIAEVDEENAEFYLTNAKRYAALKETEYNAWHSEFEKCSDKTIVIADRNPFVYLACDLGLDVHSAFHGCSADSEASFEVMLELQKVIEKNELSSIVCCDKVNRIAETINKNIKSRNLEIVVLDSMQAKVSQDKTYDSIMNENLEKLSKILKAE